MYNPYDPDFDYSRATNAFAEHKITLAFTRTDEKEAALQGLLDQNRHEPALHTEMLLCILQTSITMKNLRLLRVAERNGVWGLDEVQGNPAWGAFMFKNFSRSLDGLRPQYLDLLSKATSFATPEHVRDWIYLAIQDEDAFEDIGKKTARFTGAAELYRQVAREHGLSDTEILENIMDAISQTMVPYNSHQAEPIFTGLDRIFGATPSALEPWHAMFKKSRAVEIEKLSIYQAACHHFLDSIDTGRLNQLDRETFNQFLDRVSDKALQTLARLDPASLCTLPNMGLMTSILHGDWLDKSPHLAMEFRSLVNGFMSAPGFLPALLSQHRGSAFTGTVASLITSDILDANGVTIELPREVRETRESCESLLGNAKAIGFTRFDLFVSAMQHEKDAKTLASMYNEMADVHPERFMNDVDLSEKVNVTAACVYAEIALMREKKSEISEKTPFHLIARRLLRNNTGNPLYGIESVCKVVMLGMTEKQLLAVAPKDKIYLKALIQDGMVGIEHMKKLSPKDRKAFITDGLNI